MRAPLLLAAAFDKTGDGDVGVAIQERATAVAANWAPFVVFVAVLAAAGLWWVVRGRRFTGAAHAVGVLPTAAGLLLAAFAYCAFLLAIAIGSAGFATVAPDVATPLAAVFATVAATAGVVALGHRALGVRVAAHGVHGQNVRGGLFVAALAYLAAMPVFYLLTAVAVGPRGPQRQVLEIATSSDPVFLGLYAVAVAVTVPMFEELLFRGLLFPVLRRRFGALGGVIASAVIFMAVHEIQTWPAIFWLGMVLAFVYHYTGTLLAPLAIHAAHNTLQFVLVLSLR